MSDIGISIEKYIEFLGTVNESTDDYLYLWEIDKGKWWYSGLVSKKYELQDKGMPYCTIDDVSVVVHPNDKVALLEDIQAIADGKKDTHNMEYRWLNRKGDTIWISCRGKVQRDENGKALFMIGRVSDTALKHKVDTMTGAFNKLKMFDDVECDLEQSASGFMVVLGVDNFKQINLSHGRLYGDEILKQLVKYLEDVVGNPLQIYRLDGDCFALNLIGKTKDEVEQIYKTLQSSLPDEFTVSAGAVNYDELPIKDVEVAYQYAEDAFDKAKRGGKNKIVFFQEEDFNKKVTEASLLTELKNSVRNNCEGFSLVYQPQVEANSHKVYGAEALLRYESPKRGRVFPNEFIPILEETGLICQVGMWVIEQALLDCKKWREKNKNFHISVNVSYVQLKQDNIVEKVLDLLEKLELPGEVLTLEVTESMQLQEFKYFNDMFYKWKNAGIEISVDDFGTGYSSLAYLKNLRIDEIKIDRCFVNGIQFSSYNYRLISNMLELAKSSKIRVCCEGVELEEEMQILEGLHTNLMQGYLFAKPCEKNDFEKLYIESDEPEYCNRINKNSNANDIDVEGENIKDFNDFRCREILAATDVGLWVIRLDPNGDKNEMFADETMRRVMAIDGDLTPQQCYAHWYSRISDGYHNYVNDSVEKIISARGVVQLQYTWVHPMYGEVTVRCVGTRVDDSEGRVCIEGYHRIISDIKRTQLLFDVPTMEVFEYNQTKGTIYFHTERNLIKGKLNKEKNFPECWIDTEMVHPHFAESFREIFTKVDEKKDVKGFEFMLKTKENEYSWFKLDTKHLSDNEDDKNTIIIQLYPDDKERLMQLENRRMYEFYHASLSETIGYAEIDMESNQILYLGGLWKDFGDEKKEQIKQYLDGIDSSQISAGKTSTTRKRINYELGDETVTAELVVRIFKEKHFNNMYALVYVKEVPQ